MKLRDSFVYDAYGWCVRSSGHRLRRRYTKEFLFLFLIEEETKTFQEMEWCLGIQFVFAVLWGETIERPAGKLINCAFLKMGH